MTYENTQGCLSQRSRGDTDRMPHAEFEAPGVVGTDGLAERVAAATLAKTMRQKETFLLALCTHIATHTRHWEGQGWRLSGQ